MAFWRRKTGKKNPLQPTHPSPSIDTHIPRKLLPPEVKLQAVKALEPRKPGKKPRPVEQVEMEQLASNKSDLEKDLERWKQKYEVARTFLELQRKLERGERLPGEGDAVGGKRKGSRPTDTEGGMSGYGRPCWPAGRGRDGLLE